MMMMMMINGYKLAVESIVTRSTSWNCLPVNMLAETKMWQ